MRKRPAAEVARKFDLVTRADYEWWVHFLSLVDYKPGWMFRMEEKFFIEEGQLVMRVNMLVHDTFEDRDLRPTMVTTVRDIPIYLAPSNDLRQPTDGLLELAQGFIRDVVYLIENHEADEWLRIDGVQLFNPHGKPQHLGRRPEGWEWFGPPEIAIAPTLGKRGTNGKSDL